MAGSSISTIVCRSSKHARSLRAAGFETYKDALEEDRYRAKSMQRKAVLESDLIDQDQATRLSQLLQYDSSHEAPVSLASKTYMRKKRKHVAVGLLKFFGQLPQQSRATFTVVSKHWHYRPADLMAQDAKRYLQAVRSDLNRCGAQSAKGCLIAFIDLAFEPGRQLFVIHLHGLATGGMIKVLNRLRGRPKYKTVRKEIPGVVPTYRPIELKWPDAPGFPRSTTYLLKSHWMSTWRGHLDADGYFRPAGKSQRIPEPFHSLALLWFDKHSLSDITLMMGMEAGRSHFRRKRRR